MSEFFYGGSWWRDVLFNVAWIIIWLVALFSLVVLHFRGGPRRGVQPRSTLGPPPCSVLSMDSPLRDSSYCAGEPPMSEWLRRKVVP